MDRIYLEPDKCVGCNACVRICPIDDANVAELDENGRMILHVDDDRCIKCGECITGCTHGARNYTDDTERLFQDLRAGHDIVAIVAPAIKIAFDGNWRHAMKWLRTKGIKGIYDVGYGADICTWAHLRLLQSKPTAKVITQPCAAIVNYVLKHKNEVIKYMSPIHSPMMCTAVYLKKYLGINSKIAVISPCIAKKDEYTQTGLAEYNVTMARLKEYINANNGKLPTKVHSDFEFDDQQGLEGSIYPRPGGLRDNLLIHAPNLMVTNSEGIHKVYAELDDYDKCDPLYRPQVFDVLSCEFGCDGGPGVGQEYKCFQMNYIMHDVETYTRGKRKKDNAAKKVSARGGKKEAWDAQFNAFDKRFKIEDFFRTYKAERVSRPSLSQSDIEKGFMALLKLSKEEREFNCHSCGFSTCEIMARAIAYGINVPENCSQYAIKVAKEEKEHVAGINTEVVRHMENIRDIFTALMENIGAAKDKAARIEELGDTSYQDMGATEKQVEQLSRLNQSIAESVSIINANIEKYKEMTDAVQSIAKSINLLALNASIEAARAGTAGRGFAVVASSIRDLSEESKNAVSSAADNEGDIRQSIEEINQIIAGLSDDMKELLLIIDSTKSSVSQTKDGSVDISEAMNEVENITMQAMKLVDETVRVLS
ncbi:MAG: methyl-accepting chemotaxis protein [Lachnospiraceae bacterium]|jgi:iron only hydrogenase large subunit-like protein|nr:methyl-accepting chemotaxis protein [Lachnospiraceae bacterium]